MSRPDDCVTTGSDCVFDITIGHFTFVVYLARQKILGLGFSLLRIDATTKESSMFTVESLYSSRSPF